MHIDQTSYKRLSFIVAVALAITLLLMLFLGFGPSLTCCISPTAESAPSTQTVPQNDSANKPIDDSAAIASPPVVENKPFSFTANSQEISATGNSSNVTWLSKTDELKALLSGEDLRAQGNDQTITLAGLVESELIKSQKYAAALAFFGSNVVVNNQLVVKSGVTPSAILPIPATLKLYFDSNRFNLSNLSETALQPVISWLNEHPENKAVVQGFHDATGKPANNVNLSKNRAQTVYDSLLASGISAQRIEMREPGNALGSGELKEARRVEVTIE